MHGKELNLSRHINGVVMKNIIRFFLIFVMIFLLNNCCIFVYGCYNFVEYDLSKDDGILSDILLNGNSEITYSDYTISNWSESKIEQTKAKEVMLALKNVECIKESWFKSNCICFLQTANNSITQIKIDSVNSKKITYPISKFDFSYMVGSAFSCEIVNIFNQYYLILDFAEETALFPQAVYRCSLNNEQIDLLHSLKQTNELYKRNYPKELAHYYASPSLIIASFVIMLLETSIVMVIAKKFKTKKQRTA